ncbi:unnamed protein product [Ranitomeya imitator]|uniref:Reverse transcriptase domain-containing protein n=1 Tax=Ranitomeya imitator TaxID=111125 RepID=A0ABN9LPL5_9NEOB|nr:unnamed protein product [Ranitomeya imitator]
MTCIGIGYRYRRYPIFFGYRLIPSDSNTFEYRKVSLNTNYYDTCLPMGCSISCFYFEMFSTFLEWVAREITHLPSITQYLDYLFLVGPANSEVCSQALAQFKDIMAYFGVPLSPEKTIGPISVITFLSIEIDSIAMEFRLPREKIDKLVELINGCLSVGKVSLTQMQSLLGSLNFACRTLATRDIKQPHHRIRITAQLRHDLIDMETLSQHLQQGEPVSRKRSARTVIDLIRFIVLKSLIFNVWFKASVCIKNNDDLTVITNWTVSQDQPGRRVQENLEELECLSLIWDVLET